MKTLLLFLFTLAISGITFSQDILNNPVEIKLGVKGGLSQTDFVGSSVAEGGKWRTTWNAGAAAEYPISEGFAIRADLLYTGAGWVAPDGDDYDISYVIFPLMGKAVSPIGVSGTGSFGAGFQGGILINEFDESDMLKTFDMAIPFQVGYEHNSGVFLDATYRLGAVNLTNTENVQNTAINVDIGYFFLK